MSKKKGKEVISQKKTRPVQNKIGDAHITESNNKSWIWMILLTGITLFCFYNTLKNGFVNWDDDKNFLEHPAIQNLTRADFWEATKYIFTNNVIGNYNPLANWTFAIEKVWFGFEQPKYWHLNNVILHSICAVSYTHLLIPFFTLGYMLCSIFQALNNGYFYTVWVEMCIRDS